MPPIVIGRSANPRSFGIKAAIEFGFQYTFDKTALTNELLFSQSLYYLEFVISTTTRRLSLLLLDNAISHGKIDNLLVYRYLRVKCLWKTATSILQPLDAGVIACMKRRYKRKSCQRALKLIEDRIFQNLYKADLKLATGWM